jgi:hypothetical protein
MPTRRRAWRARRLRGAPRPARAGTRQAFVVPASGGGTTYFAIRAIDAVGNISALGNLVRVARGPD